MGNKWYMTEEDIAADLEIDEKEAGRLLRNLRERIKRKGGCYISGRIPVSYYQKMKDTDFMSPDGMETDCCPLNQKRLLGLKEFCAYASLGRDTAYRVGEKTGITKRIGHRVLFDRVLFDEWCDKNKSIDL